MNIYFRDEIAGNFITFWGAMILYYNVVSKSCTLTTVQTLTHIINFQPCEGSSEASEFSRAPVLQTFYSLEVQTRNLGHSESSNINPGIKS